MECARCHTPIPDDSRFCSSCGADLSDPCGGASTAAMDAAAAEQLMRLVKQEVGAEFEIERELGRGGMAIVYLATEVHLGRKTAIKVLPPELTFGTGAIDRFKREARTAATLDHPNIIPIYRVSPGGRLFWYAMKFLEGRSLADILKQRGRLPLAECTAVLEQVASALDYAHKRNVIHRDMKPANVVLDAQDRAIVTDFGIAKQLSAASFTASGSVIGTPYYMSPEQCTGSKTLTGAADQYSVGVMTYQMLSGQVPFEGDSAIDILTKHCTQPPPPLDVIQPGLPQHVYSAVARALAKKPDQRFPTVTEFVDALRRPTAGAAVVAPQRRPSWTRAPTAGTRPPARRRRWAMILGLGVAAGAALSGALLFRRTGNAARGVTETAVPPPSESTSTAAGAPQPTAATAAASATADSAAPSAQPASRIPTGAPSRRVAARGDFAPGQPASRHAHATAGA